MIASCHAAAATLRFGCCGCCERRAETAADAEERAMIAAMVSVEGEKRQEEKVSSSCSSSSSSSSFFYLNKDFHSFVRSFVFFNNLLLSLLPLLSYSTLASLANTAGALTATAHPA